MLTKQKKLDKKTEYFDWYEKNKHIHDKSKPTPVQKFKYDALLSGDMDCNYFWYAIKDGIGGVEDIPEFAGLIIIYGDGDISVKRNPTRLHKNKISENKKYNTAKKCFYRYMKSEFGINF